MIWRNPIDDTEHLTTPIYVDESFMDFESLATSLDIVGVTMARGIIPSDVNVAKKDSIQGPVPKYVPTSV